MLTYNGANSLLNMLCGRAKEYQYLNVYVGLSTTAPDRGGSGYTEPSSAAGYARVLLGNYDQRDTQKMSAANLGASSNTDIIYFPEATGSWGTCTHFLIFSAATDGVLVAYGQLTDEISPVSGTVPLVRVGDLTMSIS